MVLMNTNDVEMASYHGDKEKSIRDIEPGSASPQSSSSSFQARSRPPSVHTRSRSRSQVRRRSDDIYGPPPDGGWNAWMIVLSGHLVIMNTWGLINSFGIFQPYYVRELQRPPADISWIGSFEVFLLFFVGTFTGRMTDGGYFRPLFAVGFVLVLLGTFATSFCKSYWQFFLAQGICMGLGNGCLFCPSVATTSTYFQKRRALALGIAAAGSATGGLVYPSMVRELLPRIGFEWTIRAIGFVQLGTLAVAALFLKSRLPPRKSGPLVEWAAFKELEYSSYIVGAFMCFWGVYFAFYYLAAYARDILGLPFHDSLDLLLVLNGTGAIGRILPNHIADRLGTINVYIPLALSTGIMMYCWPAVTSREGLFVWAAFYGISTGGTQSMFPAGVSALTSDPSRQGTRLGMAFTIISFAALTGQPIAGAIISAQGGKYLGAQIYAGTCFFIGTCFFTAARVIRARKLKLGWTAKV